MSKELNWPTTDTHFKRRSEAAHAFYTLTSCFLFWMYRIYVLLSLCEDRVRGSPYCYTPTDKTTLHKVRFLYMYRSFNRKVSDNCLWQVQSPPPPYSQKKKKKKVLWMLCKCQGRIMGVNTNWRRWSRRKNSFELFKSITVHI